MFDLKVFVIYSLAVVLLTAEAKSLRNNDMLNRKRRGDSSGGLLREKRMDEVAIAADNQFPELNRVKRLDPLMALHHSLMINKRVRRMVEDPSAFKRSIHSMAQLQKDAKMKRIKKIEMHK